MAMRRTVVADALFIRTPLTAGLVALTDWLYVPVC
jgi:hypothetical protein